MKSNVTVLVCCNWLRVRTLHVSAGSLGTHSNTLALELHVPTCEHLLLYMRRAAKRPTVHEVWRHHQKPFDRHCDPSPIFLLSPMSPMSMWVKARRKTTQSGNLPGRAFGLISLMHCLRCSATANPKELQGRTSLKGLLHNDQNHGKRLWLH